MDEVKLFQLNKLISLGRIKKFFRSEKWIYIGKDKTRGDGGIYTGPERRASSNIKFL